MATMNIRTLYDACRMNDVAAVRHLLPQVSIEELNCLDTEGQTCLHAASTRGNQEVIRLLVDHGALRQIRDRSGRTAADVAINEDVKEVLNQPEQQVMQRYGIDENQNQRINWLFGRDKAEAFSRAIHRGCIKSRGIRKTVEKIEKANIIPVIDESKEGKTLRYFLNQAREKNDATYFVRMYTIEGPFYRTLNDYMAEGKSKEVFEKLCHKWSGYYVGCIMKDSTLYRYHFTGITYRGIFIDREAFDHYKINTVLTNKALQSSSKLPRVALKFAQPETRVFGKVSVLIQHIIVDPKSALDIRTLSEFPTEEEVLLFPGILFIVDYVNGDTHPCQVHLRQLAWTDE